MKNSQQDAERWLSQAENDLAFARVALREGFFAQACFNSHQVGEKALNALAYRGGDRYVTGHSVDGLMTTLAPTYGQLSSLDDAVVNLDSYYVPTRYPNALPGSVPHRVYKKGQAEEAVGWAAQVVQVVHDIVL